MSTHNEKKILIVEDEQLIAHSIERSLFKAGYSVPGMAASAQEAFEQIEQTKPDLVLMDIHIQGPTDGVETARVIREKYHLPVIYLTAHADVDTLERAKITEPLGYLVKPVNHANLPSSIEMALYKHKIDRQLEENRALLSTILGTIAEAVVVTNATGHIQFMNAAAEALTGWSQEEALDKFFDEVVSLDGGIGSSLLARALAGTKPILVPRDTTLQTKDGRSIFIDGQIAISRARGRAAGAMVTLHDATVRRQEEQRVRQEQRMLSVGQMANDIANDFFGLFDLIASFSEQLSDREEDEEFVADIAGYINRASRAGVTLARQLVDLGSNQGARPSMINLNEILAERQPLYNHLCGSTISVDMRLGEDLDLVLNHALHLEKLALNLILSAKHSMPYGGNIVVSTSNVSAPGEKGTADKQFVKLAVEAHRNPPNGLPPAQFASHAQNSELTLTVVNAIVAVSEGTIHTSDESDAVSTTEVLLPSIASVTSAGVELPHISRRTAVTVGLDSVPGQLLANALETSGTVVLQTANVQETAMVLEFVEDRVDLLVIDSANVGVPAQRRIHTSISTRWPNVKTLILAGSGEHNAGIVGATFLTRPYELNDLVAAAEGLLSAGEEHATHSAASAASTEKRTTAVPR
ncbi:MAG TPA: response regulator [Bryobacteraceae bacterium]|jgi:PAS domain S-box-containing protein|nr:response regulator [Bryobacteraceae bacterium]